MLLRALLAPLAAKRISRSILDAGPLLCLILMQRFGSSQKRVLGPRVLNDDGQGFRATSQVPSETMSTRRPPCVLECPKVCVRRVQSVDLQKRARSSNSLRSIRATIVSAHGYLSDHLCMIWAEAEPDAWLGLRPFRPAQWRTAPALRGCSGPQSNPQAE